MSYHLPEAIEASLQSELREWTANQNVSRIWSRESSVWTGADESKWLGWLDLADEELARTAFYAKLYDDVAAAGFSDILLMGMGGSSLCPEVLAITFGIANFHILDSTVPAQVRSIEEKLDLRSTLFIVASKSGSTLEPNCFLEYFFERIVRIAGREAAGTQFIAITDPGSQLEETAKTAGFRHIIYGKPDVGGRFSALSAFGLTAAAVMGLDVGELLGRAAAMTEACKQDSAENPGLLLGALLGICHKHGRDKLTILASPEIYDLGAWLEQLIAESTGKNGVAIIPVDREKVRSPVTYGDDRVFVYLTHAKSSADEAAKHEIEAVAHAGHPFIRIELADAYDLGREFFRWEFATAVAGSIMSINPFDQPDVESAKVEARKLTDRFEETGELPDEQPFFESNGFKLFTGEKYSANLLRMVDEKGLTELLSAHFSNIEEGDYFALLAYLEMNEANTERLQKIREYIQEFYLPATCLGFGPRFLHSTGQAYKGGGNNGVFLQITADDEADIEIPGREFTFGVVRAAQARGDFQVLIDRGRRALRIHMGSNVSAGLEALIKLLP